MTKRRFILVGWNIPADHHENAAAALVPYPFLGINQEDNSLVVSFDQDQFDKDWIADIESYWRAMNIPFGEARTEELEEENWNARWEESIDAVRISDRITIAPPWKAAQSDAEITLLIAPQMSFGTGHHETTRLIAAMLERHVKPGTFWIDAGTGTGVLAILALRLGAEHALALDFDEWSTENAAENIEANGMEGRIDVHKADLIQTPLPPSDGIVANVNTVVLRQCLGNFVESLRTSRGPLLLSGILTEEADIIIADAADHGLELTERTSESEWTALAFRFA